VSPRRLNKRKKKRKSASLPTHRTEERKEKEREGPARYAPFRKGEKGNRCPNFPLRGGNGKKKRKKGSIIQISRTRGKKKKEFFTGQGSTGKEKRKKNSY